LVSKLSGSLASSSSKQRASTATALPLLRSSVNGNNNNNSYNDDDNKYVKHRRSTGNRRGLTIVLAVIVTLYILKRLIFPLTHDQLNFADRTVRSLWVAAEHSGVIAKFPVYETDYVENFPYFSILEENYEVIRDEARALLNANRDHIPKLKHLVGQKRSESKVYTTDWKTCTY
jgi:hypothetical protein